MSKVLEAKTFYDPSEVVDQIVEVSKRNETIECSLSELGFTHQDGQVLVVFPDMRKFTLTHTAEVLMCSEAGMPHSYFKKISDDLKVKNLQDRLALLKRDRKLMVNNELQTLRGLTPVSYVDILNSDILAKLDIPNVKVTPLRNYDDYALLAERSLHFRVVLGELKMIKDKSKIFVGFNLSASELGGFFSTLPIIYRHATGTALIVTEAIRNEAYRVSYKAMDIDIAKGLIKAIVDNWKKKLTDVEDCVNQKEQADFIKEEVQELLTQMEENRISRKFVNVVSDSVTNFPISEWDFLNQVTRLAQDLSNANLLAIEATMARLTGLTTVYQA